MAAATLTRHLSIVQPCIATMANLSCITRRIQYDMKLEKAGVMLCLHVAIQEASPADSFSAGSKSPEDSFSAGSMSYEHHGIYDHERREYRHVSTTDAGMHVIRTGKTEFEARSRNKPRVVKAGRLHTCLRSPQG